MLDAATRHAGEVGASAVGALLIPALAGALRRHHTYAELCNGWLIGTRTPTGVQRSIIECGSFSVPRSAVSLILMWASLYRGGNLQPELAAALHNPWNTSYGLFAAPTLRVPVPRK